MMIPIRSFLQQSIIIMKSTQSLIYVVQFTDAPLYNEAIKAKEACKHEHRQDLRRIHRQ